MSSYKQLTVSFAYPEERYQIHALKQAGHSQSEVAGVLEHDRSTISRELRRNRMIRKYFPKNRNLRNVTREEARSTATRLNNRPRKVMDYRTPNEAFFNKEQRLTVALGT